MPRARNIKPGFFANEDLVELPFSTRLLFIGLWTLADREGRLEDRPKRIKIAIFPADDVDVSAALGELQAAGFIVRYEAEGVKCIQVVAFEKHQNPHHMEAPSTLPAQPGEKNRYNHTPVSPKQRARIYARDGHQCVLCPSTENLQIDHVKLVSDGGTSDDDNLRTLCAQCNNKRSKKPESEANRADSLIPDSLIPDSLIPDSLIPDPPTKPIHQPQTLDGDAFEQFWAIYPRKAGKQAALKAWKKVKPNAALADTIIAALAAHTQSEQWLRDDGKFIPHAATWLNGQRWTDQVTPYVARAAPRHESPLDRQRREAYEILTGKNRHAPDNDPNTIDA